MKNFNDEILFRRITADGSTTLLIHEWMENIQSHYHARYRCFARILEATGITGPFNLTYKGKQHSDTFICEYSKNGKKASVTVFLRFLDTDSCAEIWIDDHECEPWERKIFGIEKGKIVPIIWP